MIPSQPSTEEPKAITSNTQLNIQSTPQITSVPPDSPLQNRTMKPKAQDKAFGSWFTASGILSSTGLPWQQNKQVHSTTLSINTMLSNYNQDQWLLALWQLFQNTAWGWWGYRNGIQQGQQDLTLDESLQLLNWYPLTILL